MNHSRRSFLHTTAALATGTLAALNQEVLATPINSAEDVLGVRADFPVTATRTYLNSAYTAPIPKQVVAAGCAFSEGKATSPSSVGAMLKKTDEVRSQYAKLINALPDEIAFLSSTSEGENIVANGIEWTKGDNVLIDDLHYESGFVIYRHLQESKGVDLRIVANKGGAVLFSEIEKQTDKRTRLIAVSLVSSINGFRHDLRPLSDLAHANGALFYVDGIQGVGAFPLDVHASGIDFMCSGTYKWLLAGYGVAPFYVRNEVMQRIPLDRYGWKHGKQLPNGHFEISSNAKRFEYATLPFLEIYQLGTSLSYLEKIGVDKIGQHTLNLARTLRKGIDAQGKRLFTPMENESPTLTFFIDDPAGAKIAFSAAQIDVTVREEEKQVRVSPALFNTSEEVGKFLDVLKKVR